MRWVKEDGPGPMSIMLVSAASAATLLAVVLLFRGTPDEGAPRAAAVHAMQKAPFKVTPDTIRTMLEADGFREVRNIRQRGQFFSVQADTQTGFEARIVVHGQTGQIAGVRLAGPVRDASAEGAALD